MIILLGLVLLAASVTVTVIGMVLQAGGPQGFLSGVEVGVVGMIGLGMVRGDVVRRVASHRPRRLRVLSLPAPVRPGLATLAGPLTPDAGGHIKPDIRDWTWRGRP